MNPVLREGKKIDDIDEFWTDRQYQHWHVKDTNLREKSRYLRKIAISFNNQIEKHPK